MSERYQVLILGGGTAGISVAARLMNAPNPPTVAIVEPATKHYYQPLWTLVGGGLCKKEESEREEAALIPRGATWVRESVQAIDPERHTVTTDGGRELEYEDLVVTLGIQQNWDAITGAQEALGRGGVTTNYLYSMTDYTWKLIGGFSGGSAVFTFPATPIKCAGAPQKIMWLAEEHFRKRGIRDRSNVIYGCATPSIFGVPKYRAALEKLVEARGIDTRFQHNLVEIRAESKEAVFHRSGGATGADEEQVISYDMIHITPPQGPPDVVRQSPLGNAAGWVEVDQHTLQHTRFPDVWSAGDCSSLPTSKTGAAVRKQAPVLADNLLAKRAGQALKGHYDGYASCPLVTGRGRVILAEFGYDGEIMESFPFEQAEERFSMYALKAYALPQLYWHGMMRGRM